MIDRDETRNIFLNDNDLYSSKAKERGIKAFRHYGRMKLNPVTSEDIRGSITVKDHIFTLGDSLYKISDQYYGDIRYWWVLAWFNKKPIENLCKPGDIIHIPLPLEEAIYYATKK